MRQCVDNYPESVNNTVSQVGCPSVLNRTSKFRNNKAETIIYGSLSFLISAICILTTGGIPEHSLGMLHHWLNTIRSLGVCYMFLPLAAP